MPCRRAFRAYITSHSLLLLSVMTLCVLLQKALRWLLVVCSGINNYVSGVQCSIAHPPHTVQQLVLDISSTSCTFTTQQFLESCVSQSGTKDQGLASRDSRRGAQGEADLGAWGRMAPEQFLPSRLCLAGPWYECDSLHTVPSLMPVSGVYVCTLPTLSGYAVFLDCCSRLTAQLCALLGSRCWSDCCQCRWPCCMQWQQELLSSFSFLFVSSCNKTTI